MNISQKSSSEILDIVGKYVDLSSIDCSESELLEEVELRRDSGESLKFIVELFAEMSGESNNLNDRFMVDLIHS